MKEVYPLSDSLEDPARPGPELRRPWLVNVPSYTEREKLYQVDTRSRSCTCPRGKYNAPCIKHVTIALSGVPLEEATRGLLADGTRVLALEAIETCYPARVRGFDQGVWNHALCHDGEKFLVESTRLLDGSVRTRILADWRDWQRFIPPTPPETQRRHYPAKRRVPAL